MVMPIIFAVTFGKLYTVEMMRSNILKLYTQTQHQLLHIYGITDPPPQKKTATL